MFLLAIVHSNRIKTQKYSECIYNFLYPTNKRRTLNACAEIRIRDKKETTKNQMENESKFFVSECFLFETLKKIMYIALHAMIHDFHLNSNLISSF